MSLATTGSDAAIASMSATPKLSGPTAEATNTSAAA
jgi:hypothetical protein